MKASEIQSEHEGKFITKQRKSCLLKHTTDLEANGAFISTVTSAEISNQLMDQTESSLTTILCIDYLF